MFRSKLLLLITVILSACTMNLAQDAPASAPTTVITSNADNENDGVIDTDDGNGDDGDNNGVIDSNNGDDGEDGDDNNNEDVGDNVGDIIDSGATATFAKCLGASSVLAMTAFLQ
ncbi:hypothetical protein MPSEU_000674500 [Mayamaea pseudoterrestris]|nr:hypothetical protein MPSEU_000674500 [Mayamaea pseudoterrestris]